MIAGNVSADTMEDYNKNAQQEFNDKGMDKCQNCGRTFLPDRLIVHLRSCNKAHGVKESSPPPMKGGIGGGGMGGGSSLGGGSNNFGGASPQKPIVRPKTLVCYIW